MTTILAAVPSAALVALAFGLQITRWYRTERSFARYCRTEERQR